MVCLSVACKVIFVSLVTGSLKVSSLGKGKNQMAGRTTVILDPDHCVGMRTAAVFGNPKAKLL